MRYLRIDDYPYGDRDCRPNIECLGEIIDIIDSYQIPYILGVSPLLLNDRSFEYLKKKQFRCCMHGFGHMIDRWDEVKGEGKEELFANGGEFKDMGKEVIRECYRICDMIMRNFNYDHEHFIPPFNSYNQDLLDILNERGVKNLHTCSDMDKYEFIKLNHGNIKTIRSEWQNNGYANEIDINNPSQITCHWAFDVRDKNYLDDYILLCRDIKENK